MIFFFLVCYLQIQQLKGLEYLIGTIKEGLSKSEEVLC